MGDLGYTATRAAARWRRRMATTKGILVMLIRERGINFRPFYIKHGNVCCRRVFLCAVRPNQRPKEKRKKKNTRLLASEHREQLKLRSLVIVHAAFVFPLEVKDFPINYSLVNSIIHRPRLRRLQKKNIGVFSSGMSLKNHLELSDKKLFTNILLSRHNCFINILRFTR